MFDSGRILIIGQCCIKTWQKLGGLLFGSQCICSLLQGLSVIGVQQIDRVVEVVEETFKGICFSYCLLLWWVWAASIYSILMISLTAKLNWSLATERSGSEPGQHVGTCKLLVTSERTFPLWKYELIQYCTLLSAFSSIQFSLLITCCSYMTEWENKYVGNGKGLKGTRVH